MKKIIALIMLVLLLQGCKPKSDNECVVTVTQDVYTIEVGTELPVIGYEIPGCSVETVFEGDIDKMGVYDYTFKTSDDIKIVEIHVVDTIPPTIELVGEDILYYENGVSYEEQGVICFDNSGESCNVKIMNPIEDYNLEATYEIKYLVEDSSGNKSEVIRTVVIGELKVNIITLEEVEKFSRKTLSSLAAIDENNDGYIDSFEAKNIEELTIEDFELSSYSFLTFFTNLSILNILNSDFDNMALLDKLVSLESLTLNNTKLKGTVTLNNFPKLRHLDLSHNEIEEISIIESFPNIEYLNISFTNLNDLSFLSTFDGNNNLQVLEINNLELEKLDEIESLSDLREIYFNGTYAGSLDFLVELTKLEVISALGYKLTSITGISALQNLRELSIVTNDEISLLEIGEIPALLVVNVFPHNLDLEETIMMNKLEKNGVDVVYNSAYPIDINEPGIIHTYTSLSITAGQTFTAAKLDLVAYDLVDGIITDQIELITDTPIDELPIGNHTIQFRITDSDLNYTDVYIPLLVQGTDLDFANVVVFAKFNDEIDYFAPFKSDYYFDLFNGDVSVKDYFNEVSDGTYTLNSIFINSVDDFYVIKNDRQYYEPYDAINNKIGYQTDFEMRTRRVELIVEITAYVSDNYQRFGLLNYDAKIDSYIDGLTIVLSNNPNEWAELLWPHAWRMNPKYALNINGVMFREYNMQFLGDEDQLFNSIDVRVLAHELFHIIGAPDYYHYSEDYIGISVVGVFDVMDDSYDIPLEPLAYTKEKYGGWLQDKIIVDDYNDIEVILNKTDLSTDNVIRITLPGKDEEIWIEYRMNNDKYNHELINEGLLVYYVNPNMHGNSAGIYDSEFESIVNEIIIYNKYVYDFSSSGKFEIISNVYTGYNENPTINYGDETSIGVGTRIPIFGIDLELINIVISVSDFTEDSVTVSIDFLD